MKNKKGIISIVLIFAIALSAMTAALITYNKKMSAEKELSILVSEKEAASEEESTTANNLPSVSYGEIEDVPPTKEEETKKQLDMLLGNQWWYYFDLQNRECYAFKFGDDMNMEVAYFSNKNIDVGDAKYFTGTSTYSIDGDKVILRYLPDALPIKSFELTIKDNKLFFVDDKLAPHDDLSLDYPVGYYMVLDKLGS